MATPRIAIAQGSTVVRRMGVLQAVEAPPPEKTPKDWPALTKLGWMEGRNLHVERRYANGRLEALQPLAEELVRAKVEVILASGPNPTRAAMRATKTIPIVFFASGDPVSEGLVANLARPGGNVTGFAAPLELDVKSLSILKELLPAIQRVGILETSGNPVFRSLRPQFQSACQSLGLEPVFLEIATARDIDAVVARFARERVEALVLVQDSFSFRHGSEIIRAAIKRGLPTMAQAADFVRENGALAAYVASEEEGDRRLASYIDRILRGAKPADLPVEQPTQFDRAINLNTARALGLTIPKSLLLRAVEIIQREP
ncbi:MAG TPA: ABC transporter substrate-binding protein [Casimicrobiaceae bacterium]